MINFAKLLLKSYSKLNEQAQPQDATSVVASAAGVPKKSAIQVTNPTTNTVGLVWTAGKQSDGATYFSNNPKGTFPKQVGNNGAVVPGEGFDALTAFLAGEAEPEEGGGTEEVQQEVVDPVLSRLKQEDQQRLEELENLLPGTTEKLKSIFESAKLLEEDGIMSEAEILQRVLGGMSRGSLAWNLQKELEGGAVRFERTAAIGFALDDIDISNLSGSLDSMDKLAKAYAKSRECDVGVDQINDISNLVRKDPNRNSYFFASPTEAGKFGISISVADQNPINLMAQQYNNNLSSLCTDKIEGSESMAIQEKDIRANISGESGNISNIVKEASEDIQIAAFYAFNGDTEQAAAILVDLGSRFGAQAFNVLAMKKMVEDGEHVLDEKYQEMIDAMDGLGIKFASDIEEAIRGPLRTYMINSMKFVKDLKPDYAVRVGGTADKGDKSDVDYVLREKPDIALPQGSVLKVKFQDLSPEVQKSIKDSGDEIQDSYWMVGDSLKTYINEGEVKLGTGNNLGGECSRLLQDGNKHGDFIWDQLGLSDEDKAQGREVLGKMKRASDGVSKLLSKDFKTGSMSPTAARKFVSGQIKGILEQAGISGEQKRIINAAMKEYEKEGGKKAVGLVDREIQRLILEQGVKRKSNGNIDKNKSRGSLVAFAALQASIGMDSTGKNPMSSIHILSTGNTYRENQNQMVLEPLLDVLDPDSKRGFSMGASKWTVDKDGSTEFKAGKGKAECNSYINTRHLKKN